MSSHCHLEPVEKRKLLLLSRRGCHTAALIPVWWGVQAALDIASPCPTTHGRLYLPQWAPRRDAAVSPRPRICSKHLLSCSGSIRAEPFSFAAATMSFRTRTSSQPTMSSRNNFHEKRLNGRRKDAMSQVLPLPVLSVCATYHLSPVLQCPRSL